MSKPLLYDRHRDWFRDLLQLTAQRAATERSLEDAFRDGKAAADKELQTARQRLTKARDRALAEAEAKLQRAQREAAELRNSIGAEHVRPAVDGVHGLPRGRITRESRGCIDVRPIQRVQEGMDSLLGYRRFTHGSEV